MVLKVIITFGSNEAVEGVDLWGRHGSGGSGREGRRQKQEGRVCRRGLPNEFEAQMEIADERF